MFSAELFFNNKRHMLCIYHSFVDIVCICGFKWHDFYFVEEWDFYFNWEKAHLKRGTNSKFAWWEICQLKFDLRSTFVFVFTWYYLSNVNAYDECLFASCYNIIWILDWKEILDIMSFFYKKSSTITLLIVERPQVLIT